MKLKQIRNYDAQQVVKFLCGIKSKKELSSLPVCMVSDWFCTNYVAVKKLHRANLFTAATSYWCRHENNATVQLCFVLRCGTFCVRLDKSYLFRWPASEIVRKRGFGVDCLAVCIPKTLVQRPSDICGECTTTRGREVAACAGMGTVTLRSGNGMPFRFFLVFSWS